MKREMRRGSAIGALLGLVAVTASASVSPIPFEPQSRLWVEGTSTVRSYTCEAGDLLGSVHPKPGVTTFALADLERAVEKVELSVPVAELDCRNGTMNGHMRKALLADQHPTIRYTLGCYDVQREEGDEATVVLAGRLEMAGQERPITMEGTATPEPDGALRVRGVTQILMTDWGIKPPSLMMGTMKVHAPVNVHFDVVLKPLVSAR